MVLTFRKWLEAKAGGGIPWALGCNPDLPPMETDKQKLFDVYSTHTKDCQVCQNQFKLRLLCFQLSLLLASGYLF